MKSSNLAYIFWNMLMIDVTDCYKRALAHTHVAVSWLGLSG